MTIDISLNPRFNKLNSNNLRTKQDFGSRERRAIIDVTIDTAEEYVSGGMVLDCSKIRNFTQVYAGSVITQTVTGGSNKLWLIAPGTDDSASDVKLLAVEIDTGSQRANAETLGSIHTFTIEIIGI